MDLPPIIANIYFIFSGDAKRLREEHIELQSSVSEMNSFMGQMVMMLNNRGTLSNEELAIMLEHYQKLSLPNLKTALEIARRKNNPLTPDEANRLEYYINKVNRYDPLTYDEINDYSALVKKAQEELDKTSNPWPLIALAAFLLGLALASKKDQS